MNYPSLGSEMPIAKGIYLNRELLKRFHVECRLLLITPRDPIQENVLRSFNCDRSIKTPH